MITTTDQRRDSAPWAGKSSGEQPDPEVTARAQRAGPYTARYRAEILAEYEGLDKEGKGARLRREGLSSSLISMWHKQRDRRALQGETWPGGGASGLSGLPQKR